MRASHLRPTALAGRRCTVLTLLPAQSADHDSEHRCHQGAADRRPRSGVRQPALVDGSAGPPRRRGRRHGAAPTLGCAGRWPRQLATWSTAAAWSVLRDLDDAPWWIPATVAWSDAEDAIRPEHPAPAGLAHDRSWSRAVLTGLSDRLGWEARLAFERGETLATIDGIGAVRFGHRVRRRPRPRPPVRAHRLRQGDPLGRREHRRVGVPPGPLRRPGPAARTRSPANWPTCSWSSPMPASTSRWWISARRCCVAPASPGCRSSSWDADESVGR